MIDETILLKQIDMMKQSIKESRSQIGEQQSSPTWDAKLVTLEAVEFIIEEIVSVNDEHQFCLR